MCPFCFATIALASAGAATSGGLTILAVRKFYGRDQSAKNRINPGRSEKPMKHPEVGVEKAWPAIPSAFM
jgi:hypothetical protein